MSTPQTKPKILLTGATGYVGGRLLRALQEAAYRGQTAVFDPIGLLGLVYWYGIYPLHARVFAGMLRGLALRAA